MQYLDKLMLLIVLMYDGILHSQIPCERSDVCDRRITMFRVT